MDFYSIANFLAIGLYALATGQLVIAVQRQQLVRGGLITSLVGTGLVLHGVGAYGVLVDSGGFRFGFFVVPTLFFWVINLLVLISGLRKPLHNLFLFLLPLAIASIISSVFGNSAVVAIDSALAGHIVLSMVAYSLLTIATLQALLLTYLNWQLKHKHATNFVRVLPPLETMDALMFELIWSGQAVLTLSIATGVIFVGDFTTLFVSHHAVISVIAWLIYAILLWGHHRWGWRGKTAVRWAMGGFTALVLAYFGTKFAFEVVFDKPQLMESSQIIIAD